VRGNHELGAVLRGLRVANSLSQAQVAIRVCCDASLVSMVESGKRVLQPDLARRLDQLYGTGTMITSLAGSLAYPRPPGCATLEGDGDVVLVQLPLRGVTVPVSRRALLAGLTIGSTASSLTGLRLAAADIPADEEFLAETTQGLQRLKTVGRVMPPARLIDTLVGHVAVLDTVRRRAPQALGRGYLLVSAEYADYLSWMVQESGDLEKAAYWVDRAQTWAERAGWQAMVTHAHVRRSTLAITFASDGPLAVEHAGRALRAPHAPAAIKALAAKQMAHGYALAGHPAAAHQALEQMAGFFDTASTEADKRDPLIGSLFLGGLTPSGIEFALAQFRGTCDVYLGGGAEAVPALTSSRAAHSAANGGGSRNAVIASARLARAHAQAGDPEQACALALDALDAGEVLDSLTTRVELRRTLTPLGRWPGREDVAEVRHRVTALA
jgi:hypothetical protein